MKHSMTLSGLFVLATLIAAPLALAGGRSDSPGQRYCEDDGEDQDAVRRGGRHGRRSGQGFSMKRVISQLDLDDEQQEAVKQIRDSHKDAVEPYREKMQSQKEELRALWSVENPDRETILALEDEMLDTRGQMRVARTDLKLAVLELLTPEQRAEMVEIVESAESDKAHRGRRGEGRGRGSRDCDLDDE